jgi:two-component system sensor histidine kinase/response regulator
MPAASPVAAPARSAAEPSPNTPKETSRRTLLIVDDELGLRQSLKLIFKNDYELLLAENGPSAIELAKNHKIDAAILDIRMENMSGIDVLQGLKTVDPHIEVIMLTAYETIDTIRQALRLGACDYLNKPFEMTAIKRAVANAMDRRSLSFEVKANSEKLKDLADELQNQRLEEALTRSRTEIYGSIIHDINSPLTIMSGFLQLINQRIGDETKIEGEDLENVKDRLRRITKQVTNCIDISRRYLGFLRGNPDGPMRVSASHTLSDLGELMRVHHAVKHHEMTIAPVGDDVMLQINGTDLLQILRNLMVNALQATDEKHRVQLHNAIIPEPLNLDSLGDGPEERFINREGLRNVAPLLALTVEDNGPGIAPDNVKKLFCQPFTTHEAGHGIGLSIVHRLVSRAEGAIHVRTKIGQGTKFTVYLPMW